MSNIFLQPHLFPFQTELDGSGSGEVWSAGPVSLAEKQTGISTGCNTRHERGRDAGPMSCVAAPGAANRSPSASAGNSWSSVKRKSGREGGREEAEIMPITIDSVWDTEAADERKWEEGSDRDWYHRRMRQPARGECLSEWRNILMESEKAGAEGAALLHGHHIHHLSSDKSLYTLLRGCWPALLQFIPNVLHSHRKALLRPKLPDWKVNDN